MADKGITVEGVPLEKFLGEQEEVEKRQEAVEDFGQVISSVAKSIYNPPVPTKPRNYYNRSRVRKLDPDQIRKEYGLEAKPYSTLLGNLVWLLATRGPMKMRQMAGMMGIDFTAKSGWISGTLIKASRRCPELLVQDENHVWSLLNCKTVDDFMDRYNERKGKQKQSLREKAVAGKEVPPVQPQVGEAVAGTLLEAVREAIEAKLGVKVEISGEVRILFGFVKE